MCRTNRHSVNSRQRAYCIIPTQPLKPSDWSQIRFTQQMTHTTFSNRKELKAHITQNRELNVDIERETILVDYFQEMSNLYVSNNISFIIELCQSLISLLKNIAGFATVKSFTQEFTL
ncbi:unnamed protein product [Rotaria sp. Silwood2]|nr:unnamed protein product [Rotaria sp. Silwood2]CAF3907077.1 unnamed protein product [Rotaria sp. Silwood2]